MKKIVFSILVVTIGLSSTHFNYKQQYCDSLMLENIDASANSETSINTALCVESHSDSSTKTSSTAYVCASGTTMVTPGSVATSMTAYSCSGNLGPYEASAKQGVCIK